MGRYDLPNNLPETGKLIDILISEEQKDANNLTIPIPELIENWGWDWVCRHRKLSEEFIEEWLENFDVKILLENQLLSLDFSTKIRGILHYKLLKRGVSHIFSNTTGADLRELIKKNIRSTREKDFRAGTVTYQVYFSGLVGKIMFDNFPKDTKVRIRTSEHSRRALANLIYEPKKVSNEIVISGNNAYNSYDGNRLFII